MVNTIISDLWSIFNLFINLLIFTMAIGINLLFSFRVMYMFKERKDPINAIKKPEQKNTLQDVLMNQSAYDEINNF